MCLKRAALFPTVMAVTVKALTETRNSLNPVIILRYIMYLRRGLSDVLLWLQLCTDRGLCKLGFQSHLWQREISERTSSNIAFLCKALNLQKQVELRYFKSIRFECVIVISGRIGISLQETSRCLTLSPRWSRVHLQLLKQSLKKFSTSREHVSARNVSHMHVGIVYFSHSVLHTDGITRAHALAHLSAL